MRFMHRHRRWLSLSVLAGLFVAMTTPPAAAEYNPRIGRYLQQDPNGQALVLQALRHNAENPMVTVSMAYQLQYGDGMNFYEYLRSNPANRMDPSGLKAWGFDYFAGGDQVGQDWFGQRLYTLGTINEGARWASLGLQTTLDIAGGLLGLDVFESVQVLASGRGGFWDSMNIVMAVTPFGRIANAGGKLAKALKYARRGSRAGDVAASAAKHLFKILPYNKAKKLTEGFGGDIMAHHILEVRHLKKWNRVQEIPHVPSVILTRQQHNVITQKLQTRLKTGTKHEPDEVLAVYREVYTELGFPEWLDHIEKYFR